MNTYDQEVFNYLTQQDNYRAAKEISGQIGRIDQQLIRGFWQDVTEKVSSSIDNTAWKVDLTFDDGEWFSIRRTDWQSLGINCDQLSGVPDLGIHAPEDVYDRTKVNGFLEPLRMVEGNGRKATHGWPYYNRLGFDFYQSASLEGILPAHREDSVAKASTTLLKFFNNYYTILDQIEREAKI